MRISSQEQKLKAIDLAAKNRYTAAEIAKAVGVCQRTITAWRADKDFQQAVAVAKDAWRGKARGTGIADRDFRLRNLNDRYKRMRTVIEERAKDPQMQLAPGGKTGLRTVTYKSLSHMDYMGEEAVKVIEQIAEYEVDTGLLREMREHEEMAARELGQRNEKPVTPTVNISVQALTLATVLTPDERFALERRMLAAQAAQKAVKAVEG